MSFYINSRLSKHDHQHLLKNGQLPQIPNYKKWGKHTYLSVSNYGNNFSLCAASTNMDYLLYMTIKNTESFNYQILLALLSNRMLPRAAISYIVNKVISSKAIEYVGVTRGIIHHRNSTHKIINDICLVAIENAHSDKQTIFIDDVYFSLLQCKKLTASQIYKLCTTRNMTDANAIVALLNPKTGIKTIKYIATALANKKILDTFGDVSIALAQHTDLPEEVIPVLLTRGNQEIIEAIVDNPNCPDKYKFMAKMMA